MSVKQQLQSEYDKERRLVAQLMERDGERRMIKRELKENKKRRDRAKRQYDAIVRSKTWKLLTPFRTIHMLGKNIQSFFKCLRFKTLVRQNEQLLQERELLQQELENAKGELNNERKRVKSLILQSEQTDFERFRQVLRESKHSMDFMDDLDDFLRKRKSYDEHSRAALIYAAKLFKHERADFMKVVYNKVLSGLKIEEIPEFIVRMAETSDTIPLQAASSFRASLSMRARTRQLGTHPPEWVLDHKMVAYTFIDDLGVRRPWVKTETFKHTEIPRKEGIVIKPLQGTGSRGVYLVLAADKIQDVRRSLTLRGWEELVNHIGKDLASGWVEQDEWIIEQLVYEDKDNRRPARDIKFYCFYGKIGLILEITRFPNWKYCWWTPDGQQTRTGKYEDDLFSGVGVSEQHKELAAAISSEIPAPFMRIDFLMTEAGLVFGEFTPKPGNYDEFDSVTDQLLGDYFLEAEGRLITDLLQGKKFNRFNKLLIE